MPHQVGIRTFVSTHQLFVWRSSGNARWGHGLFLSQSVARYALNAQKFAFGWHVLGLIWILIGGSESPNAVVPGLRHAFPTISQVPCISLGLQISQPASWRLIPGKDQIIDPEHEQRRMEVLACWCWLRRHRRQCWLGRFQKLILEEAMAADSAAMYRRMSFDRGNDPGVKSSVDLEYFHLEVPS